VVILRGGGLTTRLLSGNRERIDVLQWNTRDTQYDEQQADK
jgi:hypothetical protein